MTSSGNALPTSLFVGNLDPRVYRELLEEIFSLGGKVTQCHVVFDKGTGLSSGFGFVDYEDNATAQAAMDKFRGRSIYGKTLTIDWARASAKDGSGKGDETAAYCLFVGNLSPDVTDEQLLAAFREFGSCVSAKCAKDPVTNKTQGFAFVSFQTHADASLAMEAMNGQVLSNRSLRVEWAKGKTNTATRAGALGISESDVVGAPSARAGFGSDDRRLGTDSDKQFLSFETIVAQTSPNNITAYVAGLKVTTPEQRIREVFSRFGEIREIRIPESIKAQATETMYAFVRYLEHESAARAIFECQRGTEVDSKIVQVHWGRESARRAPVGGINRGPGGMMQGYGGGYRGQPQHPPAFHAQPYAGRMPYGAQPYGRAPGPMYHQPHAGQNRYRPY